MKLVKYAVKRRILSWSPAVYWTARRLAKGLVEPEIGLLPILCDVRRAAVDVGANWGVYSYFALPHARWVHCFEPQPRLARVLESGLARMGRVTVHDHAVSDRDGWAELRVPRMDIGYATIERRNALDGTADLRGGVETLRVATRRLDDCGLQDVGFVKIDVEGHEEDVLAGAQSLLARDRPTLLIEAEERHRRGSVARVRHMLADLGYRRFVLRSGELARNDVDDEAGCSCRNWIFIHD